ncbi:MAG: hypothetical protein ABIA11_03930 [Patescibacteria group bacterium]|nr:hypothetical protein [Patescibacteria group bacterium]
MKELPKKAILEFKNLLERDTGKKYSYEEAKMIAYRWIEDCCYVFDIMERD